MTDELDGEREMDNIWQTNSMFAGCMDGTEPCPHVMPWLMWYATKVDRVANFRLLCCAHQQPAAHIGGPRWGGNKQRHKHDRVE